MCSLHIRADETVQVGNVNSRKRNHTIRNVNVFKGTPKAPPSGQVR